MALVPTLLALVIGLGLGLRWGGRVENVLEWRPFGPVLLLAGLAVVTLVDLLGFRGGFAVLLALVGMGLLLAFAVLNIRVGGMVLVVAGLGSDLLVSLLNWGTPVSASALVSSGIVDTGQVDSVTLTGGRQVAEGAFLGFLGDVIALPWSQVISIGDLLTLVGLSLVTASVVRRYEVRGAGRSSLQRRSAGGPSDYRSALDALGRGPAPRRGPGLHPSRLEERRRPNRQRRPGAERPAVRRRPGSGPR